MNEKHKDLELDIMVSDTLWRINDKVKQELFRLIDDVKSIMNEEQEDLKD